MTVFKDSYIVKRRSTGAFLTIEIGEHSRTGQLALQLFNPVNNTVMNVILDDDEVDQITTALMYYSKRREQ